MKIPCDVNLNCCGIYLIRNKINNKIYIGQSNNIHRRWLEHLRSGQPEIYKQKNERDSKAPIHLAMQKYGIENFSIEILEKTRKLDEREKYWISKFQSTNSDIGYNILEGGQKQAPLKGEKHGQAKLTQKEVDKIKQELIANVKTLTELSKEYNISKSTLSMINQGKIWKEKRKYPLRETNYGSKGSKNPRAKFSEKEVMEIRTLYSQGKTLKDIPEKYKQIASDNAILAIMYNKTYKHLPKWDKKTQQWI